jgi:hypothetical protein
MKEPIE